MPYIDRYENPCVYACNDGVNFFDAFNLGYLDDLSQAEIKEKDYFSDPHLIYNSKEKRLELFYRLNLYKNNKKQVRVLLIKKFSYDGKIWSERQICFDSEDTFSLLKCKNDTLISPSIIFNKNYRMYFVDNLNYYDNKKVNEICFSTSDTGLKWTKKQVCHLNKYVFPWHIDCQFWDEKYYLTVYDFNNTLTLFTSDDGINFLFEKVLLKKSHITGHFYSYGLYRACLVKDKGFKLYFSARYQEYCCLGLLSGSSLDNMKVVSVKNKVKFKFFLLHFTEKYFYVIYKLTYLKRKPT